VIRASTVWLILALLACPAGWANAEVQSLAGLSGVGVIVEPLTRICRMDSRSVAIAPPSSAGADDALDHPASPAQAPAPRSGAGSPGQRSRSPIYVFTIPILAFTMSDLGVHVAPIQVFTFDRFGRSRSTGTHTHGSPPIATTDRVLCWSDAPRRIGHDGS
jgi:hypothetical protein